MFFLELQLQSLYGSVIFGVEAAAIERERDAGRMMRIYLSWSKMCIFILSAAW